MLAILACFSGIMRVVLLAVTRRRQHCSVRDVSLQRSCGLVGRGEGGQERRAQQLEYSPRRRRCDVATSRGHARDQERLNAKSWGDSFSRAEAVMASVGCV